MIPGRVPGGEPASGATWYSERASPKATSLSITTVVSGVVLYGLGTRRWAAHFRFVPYFVVGGFLSATGWLLIVGGVRMTVGGGSDLERLADVDGHIAAVGQDIYATAYQGRLAALAAVRDPLQLFVGEDAQHRRAPHHGDVPCKAHVAAAFSPGCGTSL